MNVSTMLLTFFLATLLLITGSCKKDCETCLNGGTCNKGTCDCPDGYEGGDCGDEETPRKMFIHSIEVLRFPALDQGSNWDALDGPDIFWEIYEDNTLVDVSTVFYEDADPAQDYLFDQLNVEINDPTDAHVIQLLDYDDGITDDDWMGGIEFPPYFEDDGFPTSILLDAGGAVAFRITVSYVW